MDDGPRSLGVVMSVSIVECCLVGFSKNAAQEGCNMTVLRPSWEDGRCVLAMSVAASCLGRCESDLVGWSQGALARQSSDRLGPSATALQLGGFEILIWKLGIHQVTVICMNHSIILASWICSLTKAKNICLCRIVTI